MGQGVRDSHALIGLFAGTVRTARTVYTTGLSMGGRIAPGNLSDNRFTPYRIEDGYGPPTAAERALNRSVLRVAPTARPSTGLSGVPRVSGDPRIPVLSLVRWAHGGRRPGGDPVLDPRAVAAPGFGCRFTDPTPGTHPGFAATPAPRPDRSPGSERRGDPIGGAGDTTGPVGGAG